MTWTVLTTNSEIQILFTLLVLSGLMNNGRVVAANDSEEIEGRKIDERAFGGIYEETKRGGARPMMGGWAGSEKRGGGRSFVLSDAEKRGGGRGFNGGNWKRGGGRYFSYFGDSSSDGDWPTAKRGGGRAFQQKRGGARSFLGGMSFGDAFDGGYSQIIPGYAKTQHFYTTKSNEVETPVTSDQYFYQNNHNFDGLKRGGSRAFVWPWMNNYGRTLSRGVY